MNILVGLILLLLLLLVVGLYRPWWVLWWMARQNRKKVLQLYGIPLVILVLLYFLVKPA
jgi:hypothetical protein